MIHAGDITKLSGYALPPVDLVTGDKKQRGDIVKKIAVFGREYFADADGYIYSHSMKRMALYTDKDGYKYVLFRFKGKRRKVFVHRLIAYAFLEKVITKNQVNHIDGNKANNRADNLEWVDPSENQMHSRYILDNMTGFHDTPVICVETGELFISTRDAWRKTGVSYSHISECARQKRKTAGGYHWKSGDIV